MLSHYVIDHHNDRDYHLPLMMAAYRFSEQETTRSTLYYALLPRKRLADNVYGLPEEEDYESVRSWRHILAEAYAFFRKNQIQQQLRQEDIYEPCQGPFEVLE